MIHIFNDYYLFLYLASCRRSTPPVVKYNVEKEVEEVKAADTEINHEFESAQEKIFDTIENVEKVVLHSVEDLIHDEVDVLFGVNHCVRKHNNTFSKKRSDNNSEKKGVGKGIKNVILRSTSKKSEDDKVGCNNDKVKKPAFFLHNSVDFMFE